VEIGEFDEDILDNVDRMVHVPCAGVDGEDEFVQANEGGGHLARGGGGHGLVQLGQFGKGQVQQRQNVQHAFLQALFAGYVGEFVQLHARLVQYFQHLQLCIRIMDCFAEIIFQ